MATVERGTVTNAQIIGIKTILGKLKMKNMNASLVEAYTDGRTGSTAGMNKEEATELIGYLKGMDGTGKNTDKMRKKIIAYAHEMGWHLPNMAAKPKVDMERVNGWCVEYGKFHKKLNDHSYKELTELVTQFGKVYESFLNGL